jgi:hypothetical protein
VRVGCKGGIALRKWSYTWRLVMENRTHKPARDGNVNPPILSQCNTCQNKKLVTPTIWYSVYIFQQYAMFLISAAEEDNGELMYIYSKRQIKTVRKKKTPLYHHHLCSKPNLFFFSQPTQCDPSRKVQAMQFSSMPPKCNLERKISQTPKYLVSMQLSINAYFQSGQVTLYAAIGSFE